MNLYNLKSSNNDYYYVLAENPTQAENRVREWLTSTFKTASYNVTFTTIELVASTTICMNVTPLFICENKN
jgi:hypothetical protein